jgi:hypothetical protein
LSSFFCLVVIALVILPKIAFAGMWCDVEDPNAHTKALQKVAAGTRDKTTLEGVLTLWCVIGGKEPTDTDRARRTTLVTNACSKIIPAHDKKKADADAEDMLQS